MRARLTRTGRFSVYVGYTALMASVALGLTLMRQPVITSLSLPDAASDWQEWRDAAEMSAGTQGPVQRRVPEAVEPPPVIWLRDYFPICLLAVLGSVSILFVIMVLAIRGVMAPNVSPREDTCFPDNQG